MKSTQLPSIVLSLALIFGVTPDSTFKMIERGIAVPVNYFFSSLFLKIN